MANPNSIKEELAKLRQSQAFMIIGLLLFAVVASWVGVSLLTSQQRTSITSRQQQMATPLQPTIDTTVIDSLENQTFYSDAQLSNFTIYKVINAGENQKLVVPIDTPEDAFTDTAADSTEEPTEQPSGNLLEALNAPETGTGSGAATESGETSLGGNQTDTSAAEPEN